MATRSGAERQRLKGFRLGDVPIGVRLRAKEILMTTDGSKDGLLVPTSNPFDRVKLGIAAEKPSERVHWIPLEAWERAARKWERRR